MVSSIYKKKFNLIDYGRILNSHTTNSFLFFVSQFGNRVSSVEIDSFKIKSCKVSLTRKIIENDIVSGSSYLFFLDRSQFENLNINLFLLKSLNDIRLLISRLSDSFKIQTVLFGPYLIDYFYLDLLVRPIANLFYTFSNIAPSSLILPIFYFILFISKFFSSLFMNHVRLLSFLNFKKNSD